MILVRSDSFLNLYFLQAKLITKISCHHEIHPIEPKEFIMFQRPHKLLFLLFIHTSIILALDDPQQNKTYSKSTEPSFDDLITIFEPTQHDPTLDLAQSTPDCLDFIYTACAH